MAAASSSSMLVVGMREEDKMKQLQQSSTTTSSSAPAPNPPKKKRNLPGTPSKLLSILPDAEVIALSPKTLMATNRFICEVCNKGFQREQNLQLHRRGHNLPWKLRQKSTKEVRRKVYLCPEPTCVHHDPSRALGDLTGIKKHFCRKHGEKKWKCDKCSKRYAVQSDWKAHSKTCGTREYRCDCGTLFSRRDSFITHRAFCDALAQESARLPTGLNSMGNHLYGNSNMGFGLSQGGSRISSLQDQNHHPSTNLLRLSSNAAAQFDHLLPPTTPPSLPSSQQSAASPAFFMPNSNHDFHEQHPQPHDSVLLRNKPFHGMMQQLPANLQNNSNSSSSVATATNLFNLGFFSHSNTTNNSNNNNNDNNNNNLLIPDEFSNGNGGEGPQLYSGNLMGNQMAGSELSSLYNAPAMPNNSILPQMSATALLQKAAQMGATTSRSNATQLFKGFGAGGPSSEKRELESLRAQLENENHFQDLMNSLTSGAASSAVFGGNSGGISPYGGGGGAARGSFNNVGIISSASQQQQDAGGGTSRLRKMEEARLHQNLSIGIGGPSDRLTRDFLGVGGLMRSLSGGGISQQHSNNNVDVGSFDGEMSSAAAANRSFRATNLQ
ncbi:hypothetical protein ACLOJK_017266 [Asimina triloba]